jgi:hypothetical protein
MVLAGALITAALGLVLAGNWIVSIGLSGLAIAAESPAVRGSRKNVPARRRRLTESAREQS